MADEVEAQARAMAEQITTMNKVTGIPPFYGDGTRDTLTPDQLINRIEAAARLTTWTAARKCRELEMALRERALMWYEGLATMHDNFDFDLWEG